MSRQRTNRESLARCQGDERRFIRTYEVARNFT
jgi:hypothetical protein